MRLTRAALTVSQPATPLASAYWRSQGLVALFDQRTCVEVIHGVRGVNTATQVQAFHGQAMDYSGTANTQYEHRPAYVQTGPVTIVALVEVDALTNYGALISKQGTPTRNCPYEWRLGNGATDSNGFFLRADAADFQFVVGGGATVSAGYRGVMAVTCAASNLSATNTTLYWDGGSSGLGSKNGTGTGSTDNESVVWIGRRSDGATQLDGRIYYVALFDRVLGQDEILKIIYNPWALYEGPPRVLPFRSSSTASTINAAALTFTASALAGSSTAVSTPASAALTFTASALAGQSTAVSTANAVALTFAASAMAGQSTASATIGSAALTFTAATLVGSDGASSTIAPAALTFTPTALAGSSVALSTIDAATLTFTASALVGSDGAVAPAPSLKPGGKAKKRKPRKFQVEIDGEVFDIATPEEGEELLAKVREEAEEKVRVVQARAAKTNRRRTGKILRDARKALTLPEITAPPSFQEMTIDVLNQVSKLYSSALRDIEIEALMRRREFEIESDDEDILLLL